ncbi:MULTISPECIES: hypothetical protein [Streptomyces]|uniref:hypothetical protein n=1 Tax=Streptomyces TaxID=1883 RepID=UPI00227226D9|nr:MULTISPECIES: hypothetical protein [unclassified Streptomyces]MCY0923281.1 hypothetical protein [Streptomyces sp. H27-G5]MCY0943976.1 hypothetical protein [Streptomyces sp. H34-AA3]MCY0956304.1 hypothetical protein [Streptomyces sp. H27-H5]MCZ4082324.1 hypothetical protein [Streptomyces sp. H34-S5]
MTDVAARNRRNKRRGSDWEAELRDQLRSAGFDIERLRLTGKDDEGDHVVRRPGGRPLIIEAKNAKFEPSTFVREVLRERDNYARHRGLAPSGVDAVAVVRRRGANWRDAYVLTTVSEYFGLSREAER